MAFQLLQGSSRNLKAQLVMEDQCSPLSWGCCFQEEGMEELKHTLFLTTLELETTLISANEEISRREIELIHLKDVLSRTMKERDELIHLKDVLSRTMKERDEAQGRCEKLMLEKFVLQQQLQQKEQQQQQESASLSAISSSEDESKNSDSNKQNSSYDSIVSSPSLDSTPPPVYVPLRPKSPLPQGALKLAADRPLPEKGKLLLAVKDAGPLLQNLILAGPLPQWQHPPPQLTSVEIPPVAISSPTQHLINQDSFNNQHGCSSKRGPENYGGFDSSLNTKLQKLVLH